ncbi:MAG: peptidylprolyl isomerase [Kordiimonas sp.]
MLNRTKLLLSMLFLGVLTACGSDKTVNIEMLTDAGAIQFELYEEKAPITVGNFLRYVDAGYYDGASFYRVVRQDNQMQNAVKIDVIQGGLGMDNSTKYFPAIPHETTEQTGVKHVVGAISMGRLEPGTADSEFFITVTSQPELDFGGKRYPDGQGFAAFGKITQGLGVVQKIQMLPTDMPKEGKALEYTSGQLLLEPVRILSVKRLN